MSSSKKDNQEHIQDDLRSDAQQEKFCFVIMPIADHKDYPNGHFDRVYKEIIKPACEEAGFKAIRADDVTDSNNIVVDVLRSLVKYDMALCDLSSNNANVFYELGIRQMAKQPVVLIKDSETPKMFDVAGIRYTRYDSTLRVDLARRNISEISSAIKSTYDNREIITTDFLDALSVKVKLNERVVEVNQGEKLILDQINELRTLINNGDLRSGPNSYSYIHDINGEPLRPGDFYEYVKLIGGNMPERERNFYLIASVLPIDDCITSYSTNQREEGAGISTFVLKNIQMGVLAYRKLDPSWIENNFPEQFKILRRKGIKHGFK